MASWLVRCTVVLDNFNTLVLALAFMSRIFRVLPIADLLRAEYCQNLLSIIFVSSDYAKEQKGV